MAEKQVVTRPGGTLKNTYDATANDSDKTFTVPSGKMWDVHRIFAQLQTTATVGNRNLAVYISDGTNPVMPYLTAGPVAATQYGSIRLFFDGQMLQNTTVYARLVWDGNNVNAAFTQGLGKLYLAAGSTIRVYDSAAIDAAADDLIVRIDYIEYEA